MKFRLDATHSIIRRTGVPEGWTEYAVGDVVEMFSGGTPDRKQGAFWRGGTIPWITPTDLTANANRYISSGEEAISEIGLRGSNATLLEPGTIIFSSRGTVGNLSIAAVPLTINQSCEALRPKWDDWSSEFLYYLLGFGMSAFHRLAGGTTFGAITRREIARVRFAFPPPAEQAAIARVLDAVDTSIECTRTAIGQAEALTNSLLREAFERLDEEPTKLSEFINDIRYGTSQASHERGRGVPTLRIPNVAGDRLSFEDLVFVDLRPVETEQLALQEGDLLMVRSNGNPNYVGRSAVFRAPDAQTWIYASYLIRVRLDGRLLPDFVNIFLGISAGRKAVLRRVTTSAGNHNINTASIKLLPIPVPKTVAEQQLIIDIATKGRAFAESLRQKLTAQQTLKTALLQDLLTGKVRVGALAAGTLTSSI